MKRYALACGALALVFAPGALPIAGAVIVARAIRRFVLRRKVKRIVISYGRTWDPEIRGEA